jgi:NAD(P)-dependent dehydrogenase (short-subunit alcohol dehydrogenase family)
MDTQSIEELVDLTGKAAIVTGGATGIGQTVALALAELGAGVMIADRNLDAARETVAEIEKRGGYAEAMAADATSMKDARRVALATVHHMGGLDILINAAATFTFSPALREIEELWHKTLSAHVQGVHAYCQAAAEEMISTASGGRIINIASVDAMNAVGQDSDGDHGVMNVAALTKLLSVEYAPYEITVNALAPGRTPRPVAQVQLASVRPGNESVDMFATQTESGLVLEDTAGSDELATVVLFLVSDAGKQINGNLVVVEQ